MHENSTIHYMKRDPIDFVYQFFSVQNFISTHERFGVLPINGSDMWPKALSALVLPPPVRLQPRRPEKLRQREANEAEDIPKTQTIKVETIGCADDLSIVQRCWHNIRTCT